MDTMVTSLQRSSVPPFVEVLCSVKLEKSKGHLWDNIQCTLHSVQCKGTLCSVQCAMCSVQCAVCNVCSGHCKAKRRKSGEGWDNGHNRRGSGCQASRMVDNNNNNDPGKQK